MEAANRKSDDTRIWESLAKELLLAAKNEVNPHLVFVPEKCVPVCSTEFRKARNDPKVSNRDLIVNRTHGVHVLTED